MYLLEDGILSYFFYKYRYVKLINTENAVFLVYRTARLRLIFNNIITSIIV